MPFSEEQYQRYSRQISMAEFGPEGQEKLSAGKVLVIGAGGLGSAALMYLAAAGVGTLGVADFDVVERSNLNRQIIHTTSRLRMLKALSAEKTLRELNPDIQVIPLVTKINPGNITGIIRNYDVVLDCTDRITNKLLVNDACVTAKIPFVHAGILEMSGQILTWVPGSGPCLRCLAGSSQYAEPCESCREVGVLGAAVGVLSCMQALEAIKLLLGKGKLLTGRLLSFDGWSMTFTETVIPAHSPYCRVCGDHPDITDPASCPEEYLYAPNI